MNMMPLACLLLAGCAASPQIVYDDRPLAEVLRDAGIDINDVRHEPQDESRCPPLPTLRPNATLAEHSLWRETVIALYVQCARSKQ